MPKAKLVNSQQLGAHEDRLKIVKEQHADQLAQIETQRPQPLEFEQYEEEAEPFELDNGVVVLPGHYFNRSFGIVVNPKDKAWKKVR